VILSILICTVKSRSLELNQLLNELDYLIQTEEVQILWLGDNKSMSVGKKRNKLMSIADGDYLCFVDDDDGIEPDYIKEILKAIRETQKPVITFLLKKTENGQPARPYRFSREYSGVHVTIKQGDKVFLGYLPGHLCVWKRELAQGVQFPDINQSEDHRWAAEIAQKYGMNDQYVIEKELYHYRADKSKSLTRNR